MKADGPSPPIAEEEEAEEAGVVFRCNWLFTLADSF